MCPAIPSGASAHEWLWRGPFWNVFQCRYCGTTVRGDELPEATMKAIVLLSGGMDSAVMLAQARRDGRECHALTFDYGQRNSREVGLAHVQARKAGIPWCRIDIEVPTVSALLGDSHIDMNRNHDEIGAPGDRPTAYVAGRNTIFLAYALSCAETFGADEIWIGVNLGDYHGFPDCRPEYLNAFEKLCASMGKFVSIKAPLAKLTKRQVAAMGNGLGVNWSITSSCYLGTDCRECDACILRRDALESSHV
jgi:7-cyano-7-deazaguanine synthase